MCQWNVTGGNITFKVDHCELSVHDKVSNRTKIYRVNPPYSDQVNEDQQAEAYPAKVKRRLVDSNILHRRLGYRSIPILLHASENNLWLDTKINFVKDEFCDDCKITTIQHSNKGNVPTEDALIIKKAEEAVTMDIVPNTLSKGLTPSTNSDYYLLVCDVYSKFTMLIGITNTSSKEVINAVLSWRVVEW